MAYVLELFKGTGSVGKCCEELGWECISVDIDKQFNPDHLCNILDFDYKQYDKNHFSIIWASPPCQFYSKLQDCWIGREKKNGEIVTKESLEEKRKLGDQIVLKTLEIINYFNVELWFMENPQTGYLKNREIVKDLPSPWPPP